MEDYKSVSEYKKAVYDEVFTLAYHGNGGWTWDIAFSLPIHIRRYCLKMIRDYKEKEQEAIDNKNKNKNTTSTNVKIPDVVSQSLNQNNNSSQTQSTQRRKSPVR